MKIIESNSFYIFDFINNIPLFPPFYRMDKKPSVYTKPLNEESVWRLAKIDSEPLCQVSNCEGALSANRT